MAADQESASGRADQPDSLWGAAHPETQESCEERVGFVGAPIALLRKMFIAGTASGRPSSSIESRVPCQ